MWFNENIFFMTINYLKGLLKNSAFLRIRKYNFSNQNAMKQQLVNRKSKNATRNFKYSFQCCVIHWRDRNNSNRQNQETKNNNLLQLEYNQ